MASQSQPPTTTSIPSDDNSHKQAETQQDVRAEAPKPISPPSVFVNSEPIREDQVQNAVKFLSHPKVQGSPVMYRRSFLEKKGLSREEIDEAFRRVPDPPPSVQTSGVNQDVQRTSSGVQPQTMQPSAAAPANAISPMVSMRSRFHWSHAVLAIGLLAISGAGSALVFKKSIVPRLKSWIRKVVLDEELEENDSTKKMDKKPSLAEEAAAAAKAAAAAAADVAKASQEMTISKNEEKKLFSELMNMLDMQVHEMKSMSSSIRKLEGETSALRRSTVIDRNDHQLNVVNSTRPYVNGKNDYDSRSVRSASPPAPVEPPMAPHPKSFMDIMAMVQRGEKPTNVREIDDSPPNPNQQLSNPRLAPRAKPWEVSQAQNYPSQVIQTQSSSEGLYTNGRDDGGNNYTANGVGGTAPWWQQKNPRITEIENEDEPKSSSYSAPPVNEPPVRRSWVPPQPPPVAMPEAAEAIRRPKSSVAAKEYSDDELLERSSDGIGELQRITKISEKGGLDEVSSASSAPISSEIQEV